ncbi:DNA-binding protein K10 [Musca domestica]|uniref:DNA-binding protein K10 n=1 Tax=Musca domestica TaxID=7370 RepID=A0A1I8N8L6_MUSDO|nr:DNA-binding protein K10 [Musca domestica]XP_011294702.1 DNA-binding protein K10 [Musca domestica]
MVSKKNFQNGRVNAAQQQRQMPYKKPPIKPPMNTNFNNNPMFNVSQIPDNPGYLDFDFNLPTPPNNGNNNAAFNKNNINNNAAAADAKKKNNNNKNKAKNGKPQPNVGWKNNNQVGGPVNNPRFNGPRNNFGMANRGRGNRMMPPMGAGPRGMGPMGFHPPMGGFQPPMMPPPMPMRPPIPPMGMGVQPPPPFMRRNGPMPPIPPMIPPRMMPPAPFMAGGKIKKNKLSPKKVTKGKGSTVKTLKNLINQYPIDKPWVTSEIREEHDKKVDIENRLKGNKDDELFAQFKVQRDKFVAMYESAREEYLKKEAASVKAKDEKDKQTNTTKKDDKKEANTNENKKN